MVSPLAGSLKPEKSPSGVRYLTSTLASEFTSATPASKPAWNFLISSVSTPPTKPMVPVWLDWAAMAPTRNEPCSSANTREATLGSSTTESMMAKLVSG